MGASVSLRLSSSTQNGIEPFEAYSRAQEALKKLEDMTFSDEEIDAFLPKELKRISKGGGNV